MDVKVNVAYTFYVEFTLKGVDSTDEAERLIKENCGFSGNVTTGTLPLSADYEFDPHPSEEILSSQETNLPPKKTAIISGKYNEYGYVIYRNRTPVYAAGNYVGESQTYLGSNDTTGEKEQLPTDSGSLVPLEEIQDFCQLTIEDFTENPSSYPDTLKKSPEKFNFLKGEATYSKNLNPRKLAHQTGDCPLFKST